MPLRFGACTFDPQSRELRRDGTLVPLSPKAFRLLELLVDARPKPVQREVLYASLWPDVVVEPGNLHGLVSEVRTAIGDPSVIRTVHRVGYAFAATATVEGGARFSVLLGEDEIPLRQGENGIGRDPHDAVVIHAPEVSRHHARIVVAGGTVTIEDLGSKNGTFLGTRRVEGPVEVRAGDDILIGTIRLRLVTVNALAPTATAS
ncbi:MAG TPA: FHA domain-containing protein [Thermoanaerobaculia bacterium]|nr:FHA domain-containing protein [Thermoanaerobaculia bacterium]